jgi:hypothetical protein
MVRVEFEDEEGARPSAAELGVAATGLATWSLSVVREEGWAMKVAAVTCINLPACPHPSRLIKPPAGPNLHTLSPPSRR